MTENTSTPTFPPAVLEAYDHRIEIYQAVITTLERKIADKKEHIRAVTAGMNWAALTQTDAAYLVEVCHATGSVEPSDDEDDDLPSPSWWQDYFFLDYPDPAEMPAKPTILEGKTITYLDSFSEGVSIVCQALYPEEYEKYWPGARRARQVHAEQDASIAGK
jgi:hypothetical protein